MYLRTYQVELYDKYVFNEKAVVYLDKWKKIDYKRLTYQNVEQINTILPNTVNWGEWKRHLPNRKKYDKSTDEMI